MVNIIPYIIRAITNNVIIYKVDVDDTANSNNPPNIPTLRIILNKCQASVKATKIVEEKLKRSPSLGS